MTVEHQGWDRADYSCGRCPFTFTSTTEPEYLTGFQVHATAHDIAAVLTAMPELRGQVEQLLSLTT